MRVFRGGDDDVLEPPPVLAIRTRWNLGRPEIGHAGRVRWGAISTWWSTGARWLHTVEDTVTQRREIGCGRRVSVGGAPMAGLTLLADQRMRSRGRVAPWADGAVCASARREG